MRYPAPHTGTVLLSVSATAPRYPLSPLPPPPSKTHALEAEAAGGAEGAEAPEVELLSRGRYGEGSGRQGARGGAETASSLRPSAYSPMILRYPHLLGSPAPSLSSSCSHFLTELHHRSQNHKPQLNPKSQSLTTDPVSSLSLIRLPPIPPSPSLPPFPPPLPLNPSRLPHSVTVS